MAKESSPETDGARGPRNKPRRRLRKVLRVLLVLIVLGVILHLPIPARLKVSPETTVLVGPLRPDGTVDYLAALNAEAGKGVTAENNAAVEILKALGPEVIEPASARREVLGRLGLEGLGEEGDYLVRPSDYEGGRRPKDTGLLRREEYPVRRHRDLAWWGDRLALHGSAGDPDLYAALAKRSGPVRRIMSAARLSRFYVPKVPTSDPPWLYRASTLDIDQLRRAARVIAYAGLEAPASEGPMGTWEAVLATHRLGRLISQDPELRVRLAGMDIEHFAAAVGAGMAGRTPLTAEQARGMLADLDAMPPARDAIEAIDRYDRFVELDLMAIAGTGGPLPGVFIAYLRKSRSPAALDPNAMLRSVNARYNRIVEVSRRACHPARCQGEAVTRKRLRGERARTKEGKYVFSVLALWCGGLPCRSEFSRRMVSRAMSPRMADLMNCMFFQGRVRTREDVERVALALAACRAEKGAWPQKLADLSPAYLKEVPDDRFTGRPLVYRRRGRGCVLYSLGINMVDQSAGAAKIQGDDIGIVIGR